MRFNNILCVCTGNICRSPLAEGYLRRRAPHLQVQSAGIGAVVGGEMPEPAAAIAAREGLALEAHRGRQIGSELVCSADLIIVMEQGQLAWVTGRFPMVRGRVFLATHWLDGADVDDPHRHDSRFFERVYRAMVEGLDGWLARIG